MRKSSRRLPAVILAASLSCASPGLGEEMRLPPDDCVRRLRAARIAHMQGDSTGELEELRAAAEAFPREIAPIYALLEYDCRHPLGKEEQAELLGLEPSETVTWSLYRLYLELERWEEASDMFAGLVGKEAAKELRGTYVQLLGKADRLEEQSRQIELLLAENSVDRGLGVLLRSAWDLRDAGRDTEAERLFRRVLKLDPENQVAAAALIHLYGTEAERDELAVAEANRWTEESDPRALFDKGTQLLTAGDAVAAIELLRRAAPELPELEAAWYNLGMAAYRLEDWETTVSAFGRAAELNPQRADSWFFRGIALYQVGKWADSVEAQERALALDKGRTLAHYYLSICYRQLGNEVASKRHVRLYKASREK